MSESKKIVNDLLTWAKDEMKLSSGEKYRSSISHQSELVQNAPLKKLWSHLTENVKSEENIEILRGNIELHDLKLETKELETSCTETRKQLLTLESQIHVLEEQLKTCESSCLQSELSITQLEHATQISDDKTTFHKAYVKKRQADLSTISPLKDNLHQKQMVMRNRNLALEKAATHSSCINDVNEIVSKIVDCYSGGLNKSQCIDSMELWKGVVNILSKYTGDTVLKVLKLITKEETDKVIKCEKATCPEKEMSAIENSLFLEDSTAGQNPASTIKKMLELHDIESAQEFLDIKGKREMCVVKEKQNQAMKLQLQSMIKAKFPDADEQQRALQTLDAEIELSSLSATLESLQYSASELQKDFDKKESDDKHIQSVLKEIKNFKSELMENKRQMLAAAEQNLKFRSSLNAQQHQALAETQAMTQNTNVGLQQSKGDMQNSLDNEVASFEQADMSKLTRIHLDTAKTVPIYDMLIHRPTRTDHNSGGTAYHKLTSSFDTMHLVCPCDLLQISHEHKTNTRLQESLGKPTQHHEKENHGSASKLQNLHTQVRAFSKEQKNDLMSQINKGMKAIDAFRKETEKFEKTLGEWWNEPAQDSVPWLKFDDMTLAELKENAKFQQQSKLVTEF